MAKKCPELNEKYFPKCNEEIKCAPHIKYDNISCIDYPNLLNIVNEYNSKNEDKIQISNNKEELVKHIYNKLYNKCQDDQTCWLKYSNKDKLDFFKPEIEDPRYQWLSTTNINEVLKQYEKVYSDYISLGTVPHDIYNFIKLDIKKLLNKGKTRISLVINLDNSSQSGSHWVAVFANLNENNIYFFDSGGNKPDQYNNKNKNIIKFMQQIGLQLMSVKQIEKDKIRFRYNNVQHQKENSECGMYCVLFILIMLKSNNFDKIKILDLHDNYVNLFRPKLFRII